MQDLKNLDCLPIKTKALLLELIESYPFLDEHVLARGSATALHTCHRKSEDLDFFTYGNNFNLQKILRYAKQAKQKIRTFFENRIK